MTIEELKEKCVEQLEVMSKKRIKRILEGKDKKAPYIHIIILRTLLHIFLKDLNMFQIRVLYNAVVMVAISFTTCILTESQTF